jgi:hypothetical protein
VLRAFSRANAQAGSGKLMPAQVPPRASRCTIPQLSKEDADGGCRRIELVR